MTAYVYRVTSKRVMCTDGKEANVAVYAYKPSWSNSAWNRKMDFQSGCNAARKLAEEGKLTDRIVQGERVGRSAMVIYRDHTVYANPNGYGVFEDDYTLGTERMPRLDVRVIDAHTTTPEAVKAMYEESTRRLSNGVRAK